MSASVDFSDLGAVPVGQPNDFSDLGATPVAQSQAAPANIDMSTVAGATPGTPSPQQAAGIQKRPMGTINPTQAVSHVRSPGMSQTTPEEAEDLQRNHPTPVGPLPNYGQNALPRIVKGLQELSPGVTPTGALGVQDTGGGGSVVQGIGDVAGGINEGLSGSILPIPAAAGAISPLRMAATAAAGAAGSYGGSRGAQAITKAAGGGREAQEAAANVGGLAGGIAAPALSYMAIRATLARKMGMPVPPTTPAEAPAPAMPEAGQPGGPAPEPTPAPGGAPAAGKPVNIGNAMNVPPGAQVGSDGKITVTTEGSLLDKLVDEHYSSDIDRILAAGPLERASVLKQQTADMSHEEIRNLRDKADADAQAAFSAGDKYHGSDLTRDSILLDKILKDRMAPAPARGPSISPEEQADIMRTFFPNAAKAPEGPSAPPEPIPTDPAVMIARQQAQANTAAMADADALNAAAKNMAAGIPPPKPPMPEGMDQGQITAKTVTQIATVIAKAPHDQQAPMLRDAHDGLAEWMAQHGKVQGPYGQITVVKNPEQAQQLAAKWVNDELDRQREAQEDQQKAQEQAAKDAQKAQAQAKKEADKQQQERQKAGEPTIDQRAKTIMDTNPERDPVPLLQRQLGLSYSNAKSLADKVRQTAPIEAAPKVGGKGHEVIEEARATVDKQVEALNAGTIKAVHIPEGSKYTPQIPEGMKRVDVKNGPGAGTFIYNPQQVRAATIKEAAKAGTHGDLLGHVNTKQEVAQSENPVIVQARDQDGTVIQDSAVDGGNAGAVEAQKQSLQERHPDATISVVHPAAALNERIKEGAPAADLSDLGAVPVEAKYKFGNTQATIPEGSDAHTAIRGLQLKVKDTDLAGDGKDIDEPHVTVRYGIQGDDTSGIRKYIESQAPFEARLGKTESFPPSEHSDGAAPIIAPVESPELHRINAEIEQHGDFTEPSFKEYKPHATVAYVKPEAASKYEGMADAHGKTFRVESIDISDRYGNKETVQLKGTPNATENQSHPAGETQPTNASPEPAAAGQAAGPGSAPAEVAGGSEQPAIKEGDRVTYKTNKGKEKPAKVVRIAGTDAYIRDGDSTVRKPLAELTPVSEPLKLQSLSERGVEATKEAMRQQNPASKRTEEQQTKDADGDIQRQVAQMRAFLAELPSEQVASYLEQNPELKAIIEKALGEQEPTHAEESERTEGGSGSIPEGKPKPDSVLPEEQHPASKGDRGVHSGGAKASRERLTGVDGRETTLLTPAQKLKALYRLVEAADLTPSHDPKTFEKNPAYPEGVQERTYDTSKEAQARVLHQAQNYDPAYTVNSNPDAVNGPPIITPDGIVLGGNSRAMSTQLAYSYGPQGQEYKDALREHAEEFGFTAAQVGKMDRPVLVREVEAPEDKDDLRRLGSELNESMTGALGVSEQAVSAGKNLSPETLRSIASMMNENDSTLREVMAGRGPELLKMLVTDRVIAERQRPKFTDKTGGLSEEGKTFIERALIGSVIDDPRLMDAAPKSVLNKIERALGAITSFAAREDEWNILPAIRAAVAELATIQANESTVELHLGQIGLFGGERNPVVDQLVRILDSKPTEARKAFESFARDSDANMPGQSRMFGTADAFDSFNNAFGSTLTAQEYLNGLVESATADPGGDVEGHGEEGNEGVSERPKAAEPTPGSGAGTSGSAAPGLREVEAEPDAVSRAGPQVGESITARKLETGMRVRVNKVPAGSYLTAGETYSIAVLQKGRVIDFRRANGAGTSEGINSARSGDYTLISREGEPAPKQKPRRPDVNLSKDEHDAFEIVSNTWTSTESLLGNYAGPDLRGLRTGIDSLLSMRLIEKRERDGAEPEFRRKSRSTDPTASVGFMGTQYADQLLKEGSAAGKKFWDADVAPNMVKLGAGAVEAGKQIGHVLYPRLGANADAQDILSRARGRLESHLFTLEHIDGGLEKFFDKMSREAQLAFIDRYKLGVGQPDQKLQQVEQMMRAIDDRSLQAAQQYKPSLVAKEDHFRVVWRVIPGSKQQAGGKSAQFTGAKRPWQGDKGFMRRATLDTISEGINAGGEPVTTNPWKLFTLAQASIMKFVAAQQAWEAAKDLGMRKYVKRGQPAPDGWVKINDRIADIYFPEKALSVDVDSLPVQRIGPKSNKKEFVAKEDLETHRVMTNPGSWYAEAGFARLLNNYLSEDRIRRSPVGSALIFAKNLTTAIELSLSPFHAIFESLEAMGSQFGLGVQRVWNNGIRLGEGTELTQGLREIATSIAAPYLISRTGGNVLRYAENPAQFFQTDRGKAFARRFPDAVGAMQELFNGGLTWGVQRDFRFDPQKSMMEAAKEGNYVGAVLRAVPWINSTMMKPLFEAYIPRLKWGLALGLYSEQLVENAEALANGDTTNTEIARKVVDTVENRFGEMNFNNIYWNNTFKSVLQLAFRSVTWKLGNMRGAGSAIGPEMLSSFRDPLGAFRRDWNGGGGNGSGNNGNGGGGGNGRGSMYHPANARQYLPKVGMNQGWLLGMLFTTAVIGTVLTKFYTHQWPWELVAEDREEGYSFPGALALEVIHPRTGRTSDYTGKPERISLPTGLRDFEHLFRDPSGYVKSSSASWASHAYDTLANRDAFKNYVYDPNGSPYQKIAEIFAYNAPKPISFENLTSKYGPQDATSKTLRAVGLGSASSSLDYSPAEQKMRSLKQHDPLTPEQVKERDQEHEHPTRKQLHRALKAKDVPYVERLFKGLSYADAREVYNSPDTSDHERNMLHRPMKEKRQNYLKSR